MQAATPGGDELTSSGSGSLISHLSWQLRPDRVCLITLHAASTHNTIDESSANELAAALDAAERDSRVHAVVLTSDVFPSARRSFLVGANIDFLRSLRFVRDAEDAALALAESFARIASAKKPVVACVHGAALGAGFALALACSATIATDDPHTLFGFPEVKLGILPAANGLLRTAERAGLEVAIDLGLSGRNVKPREALALGLIDEIFAPPDALAAACRFALRLATRPAIRRSLPSRRAWQRHRGSLLTLVTDSAPRVLVDKNPLGRALLFRRARAESAEKTRGHYPAPERMLDVLQRYGSRGFASAAKLEAQLFGELMVSETAQRLFELFAALRASKKDRGLTEGEQAAEENSKPPRAVEQVAVLGAGLMGAGIAYASAANGLHVYLTDKTPGALDRGVDYVRSVLDERVRRGSISVDERDHALSCLERGTDDAAGVRTADLVIEAVFEDLQLKHEVLASIESRVKEGCVIASNTSSLPIGEIAAASQRPERILGMHYSSPVHRTQLLEVVRTKHTAPRAVITAVGAGRRQGKHVIVVNDGVGFYTTRALWPFLREALQLVQEGVPIDVIDDALVDWGFPTGPLHMLDEMGIDLAAHIAEMLEGAFGERMHAPNVLATLRADDRRGKKNGRGFYLHASKRTEKCVPDQTVVHTLDIRTVVRPMADDLALRCAIAMVNEALRCLEEGVLRSARDGDIGAVFGLGFPSFRGGPFRYVDVLGAPEILRRARSLEQRFGARFEPPASLVTMARTGKRFYE